MESSRAARVRAISRKPARQEDASARAGSRRTTSLPIPPLFIISGSARLGSTHVLMAFARARAHAKCESRRAATDSRISCSCSSRGAIYCACLGEAQRF